MSATLNSCLKKTLTFFLILACLTSCESKRTIVNGLDEKEANEILVYLSTHGVSATKVQAQSEGGGASKMVLWNISVNESDANSAMSLLNQAGLPRRRGQNLLGIFSNSSLVPSGMQEKIRYQAGLAEQIASTIRKIDGVLDADVQISFPEKDPLNPNASKQKITASVYVKHNGILDDPNAHLTNRIKRLVAGSINGLDLDNVTVIGDRARHGELEGSSWGTERPYTQVWKIIIATESLTRFRIIFFSFLVSTILLLGLLSWILWKFYPLLSQDNGWKKLFLSLEQFTLPKQEEKVVETPPNEETQDESDLPPPTL